VLNCKVSEIMPRPNNGMGMVLIGSNSKALLDTMVSLAICSDLVVRLAVFDGVRSHMSNLCISRQISKWVWNHYVPGMIEETLVAAEETDVSVALAAGVGVQTAGNLVDERMGVLRSAS
jgi:hypothetical protein